MIYMWIWGAAWIVESGRGWSGRGNEWRCRKREVPALAGDGDQARAHCDGCVHACPSAEAPRPCRSDLVVSIFSYSDTRQKGLRCDAMHVLNGLELALQLSSVSLKSQCTPDSVRQP